MLLQLLSVLSFAGTLAAPDSTVSLGTQVFLQGAIPGDTVRYEYYADGALKLTKRSVVLTNKVTVAAPTYGGTVAYKGCAQVERGGRTGFKAPATPLCWTWSYTRPMPTLVMDSLKQIVVRPSGPTELTFFQKKQFCAFGITMSGAKVRLDPASIGPECDEPFKSFLAEVTA